MPDQLPASPDRPAPTAAADPVLRVLDLRGRHLGAAALRDVLPRPALDIEAAARAVAPVVEDVAAHPNHVYCDSASRSEIVVPLVRADGTLLGVWDVDSPNLARFDDADRTGMEALCAEFMRTVA